MQSLPRRWPLPDLLALAVALTVAGCGDGTDRIGRVTDEKTILSAYLGLLDAGPLVAAALSRVSGCSQSAGDDAMPVVFGVQLDPATVEPSDFEIVSESGARFTPSCATLRPALGDDERRTVLLTGPLGAASDPPAFVRVTGELVATDVRGVPWGVVRGIRSPPVRRVEEGPRIELAIVWASADLDVCADGNLRIQTTWSGGITGPLGREFDEPDLGSFAVEIEPVSSGDSREVSPASFGDLGDGDNHLDLCIKPESLPLAVRVPSGIAFDPTNHPNPAQTARILLD